MINVNNRRRVTGHFTLTGWYGEIEEGETLSCCHCQGSWIKQKGSGVLRGFCQQCAGYVCGPACAECVPLERRIENIEAGRPEDTPPPTSVSVPAEIKLVFPSQS